MIATSKASSKNDTIETAVSEWLKALLKNMALLLKPLWINCNELVLGIRTEPERPADHERNAVPEWWRGDVPERAQHDDNFVYATIDYWNVRKVVRALRPVPADIFYDIGSGKGRILCVLARKHLRKCVGIELFEPLCRIARRNAANLRGRKAPIEIVCGDATTADLSDGTIYFMFNPFGPETLRDTLYNIESSLTRSPRPIRVVYYNSVYESVLESLGWLERVHQFDSFGGQRVTFWENRGPEDGRTLHRAHWENRGETPVAS